jgi:hypothetical protein
MRFPIAGHRAPAPGQAQGDDQEHDDGDPKDR